MAIVNLSTKQKVTGIVLILTLVLSSIVYNWSYDRDYNTLYKDGNIIARHRWYVEMERTYTTIKYSYQKDNCLDIGGRLTATRCYYPDDYYTRLNRKLSGIDLSSQEYSDQYVIERTTPYYKYGTGGVIAGKVIEEIMHLKDVEVIEEFPVDYKVSFIPNDNTKYKLIWKIDKLKEINLPDGNYTDCSYRFGDIFIDLENECNKLDYVKIENDYDRIWIYFNSDKGIQNLNVNLIDPPILSAENLTFWNGDENITREYILNYSVSSVSIDLKGFEHIANNFNFSNQNYYYKIKDSGSVDFPLGYPQNRATCYLNGKYWVVNQNSSQETYYNSDDLINWNIVGYNTVDTGIFSGIYCSDDRIYTQFANGIIIFNITDYSMIKKLNTGSNPEYSPCGLTPANSNIINIDTNIFYSCINVTDGNIDIFVSNNDGSSWVKNTTILTSSFETETYNGHNFNLLENNNIMLVYLDFLDETFKMYEYNSSIGYTYKGSIGYVNSGFNSYFSSINHVNDVYVLHLNETNTEYVLYKWNQTNNWSYVSNYPVVDNPEGATITIDNLNNFYVAFVNGSNDDMYLINSTDKGKTWNYIGQISENSTSIGYNVKLPKKINKTRDLFLTYLDDDNEYTIISSFSQLSYPENITIYVNNVQSYHNLSIFGTTTANLDISSFIIGTNNISFESETEGKLEYSNIKREYIVIMNISLDGLQQSRIYEYETIANISATTNVSGIDFCLGINAPNYGMYYSCGKDYISFLYNISILRQSNFTNDIEINGTFNSTPKNLSFLMDNRSVIDSAQFNMSCTSNVCEGIIIQSGDWNKTYRHNDSQFFNVYSDYYEDHYFRAFGETEYKDNTSHIFPIAGAWSIFYTKPDYPTTLNLQLYAQQADVGNNVSFVDIMNTTNNSKSYNYNASTINTTYPLGIEDNFADNITLSKWTETRSDTFNPSIGELFKITDNYLISTTRGKVCLATHSTYMIEDYSDLRNVNLFRINTTNSANGGCGSGVHSFSGTVSFSITDGTNNVIIQTNSTSCAWTGCRVNLDGVFTLIRKSLNSNIWNLYKGSDLINSIVSISTVGLDETQPWHLRFDNNFIPGSGACPACGGGVISGNNGRNQLYNYEVGGIHLYKEIRNESYISTGNFTSKIFHNTSTNIISATLYKNDTTPSGTSIKYYLSADNIHYERVVPGDSYAFTNSNKNLSYRVVLDTSDTSVTPIVYKVQVVVLPSQLYNISIDVNKSSVPSSDFVWNGTLNETNSPINITVNIENFTQDDEIEIEITSLGSGKLWVQNLMVNSTLNPVILNKTFFEDCTTCLINITLNNTKNITFNDLQVDYRGYKNYTVIGTINDTSTTETQNLQVYWSPFNITILPQSINYWDISPNVYSWDQTLIPPFGNANGDGNPFWNISRYIWPHDYDIFIRYNGSVNTCANTWFEGYNHTTNTTFNVILNSSTKLLIDDMGLYTNISTFTNLSCSAENSTLILPYFCFISMASDAVLTQDWDSNCEWVI